MRRRINRMDGNAANRAKKLKKAIARPWLRVFPVLTCNSLVTIR
jgi:hypothetical protein